MKLLPYFIRHTFYKIHVYYIIRKSKLFDKEWYICEYPEVSQLKMSPLSHYYKIGWREGKNPSRDFSTNKYLYAYPDVCKNPLVHYLKRGKKEGRFCFKTYDIGHRKEKITEERPLISIIVASYNYQDLIKETLNSLLEQTYDNYEIIVVDDGSEDNSIQVIKEYAKKSAKVHLYTHSGQKNKGLPETIKLGIQKSNGKYIAFCESDDKWSVDHLEKKVCMINKYEDVRIILNGIEMFGDIIAIERLRQHFEIISHVISVGGNYIDLKHFQRFNYIATFSAIMIRRDLFDELNFDSPIPAWVDFWIYRQILNKTMLYYTDEKLTFWRQHKSYNCLDNSDKYMKRSNIFMMRSNLLVGLTDKYERYIRVIAHSAFFDERYYVSHYSKEIGRSNPASHYFYEGCLLGFNPSEQFCNDAYWALYPEVEVSDLFCPLLHYEMFGKKEKRRIISVKDVVTRKNDLFKAFPTSKNANEILLISHECTLTGAPRALLNMALVMKRNGYVPFIVSAQSGNLIYELERNEINYFIDINFESIRCLYRVSSSLGEFFSRFKIVVMNTILNAPLIKYFEHIEMKKVCWLHEGYQDIRDCVFSKQLNVILPKYDSVYCVGDYSMSQLKLIGNMTENMANIGCLMYGIQDEYVETEKAGRDLDKVKILFVGTICKRKGQHVLLNSLELLSDTVREQIEIVLIGSSSDDEMLNEICLNKYDCLSYEGEIKHGTLLRKYSDMDILLCPSLDDPMPIVCTEAMMFSKPVIVSTNTGTASFIQEGVNGYVVKAGDAEELAKAIERAVVEKDKLTEMGKQARLVYEQNFTFEKFEDNIRRMIIE